MNFEDELQNQAAALPQEREISLGTGTILAIFFAITLICAAFFGFGYSMGRRSEKAATASIFPADTASAAKPDSSPFSSFKAAPPIATPTSAASSPVETTAQPAAADTAPAQPVSTESSATPAAAGGTDGTVVQPPVSADGTWMVQVSATTRKPDAEALSNVLVRQGFTTSIRPDADGKFHVRVGPFAARKDADITRKLLVASGYKDPFLTPK